MNAPTEPGTYEVRCPLVFGSHKFEMEVYLSKKQHLRARVADAAKLRGTFQGKRIETFSEGWVWSKLR